MNRFSPKACWQFVVGLGVPLDQLLSVVVVVVWGIVCTVATGNPFGALIWLAMLCIPLALIWFSDFIAEITGSFAMPNIDSETPSILVRIFGWLGLAGMIYLQARSLFEI